MISVGHSCRNSNDSLGVDGPQVDAEEGFLGVAYIFCHNVALSAVQGAGITAATAVGGGRIPVEVDFQV